jgi:predicted glycosyltransferase
LCSYDQRGLGRTSRTLDIASSLAQRFTDSAILVLSNLSIVGRFRTPACVDVVRLPSIGPSGGAEGSLRRAPLERDRALLIRRTLAERTIESFRPDLVVIDRDPVHVPSEMQAVLATVRERLPKTRVAWALPDVVGAPGVVGPRWTAAGVYQTLDQLCDEIWVYGVRGVFDQAREYQFPAALAEKVFYTGYLRSPSVPPHRIPNDLLRAHADRPLVLVTAGGGASGYPLISNYLDFLERVNGDASFQSVVISGPMMPAHWNAGLSERARKLPHVIFHRFSKHVLQYLRHSQLAISRGGYNTLCANLTYRKPSILVPDEAPPHEHLLRADVFGRLRWCGLVRPSDLSPDRLGDSVMSALSGGSDQPSPERAERVSLDGLDHIGERVRALAVSRRLARHGSAHERHRVEGARPTPRP